MQTCYVIKTNGFCVSIITLIAALLHKLLMSNFAFFFSFCAFVFRTTCCDLFNINLSKLVSWLMLAFVHCREVPILFQKVTFCLNFLS